MFAYIILDNSLAQEIQSNSSFDYTCLKKFTQGYEIKLDLSHEKAKLAMDLLPAGEEDSSETEEDSSETFVKFLVSKMDPFYKTLLEYLGKQTFKQVSILFTFDKLTSPINEKSCFFLSNHTVPESGRIATYKYKDLCLQEDLIVAYMKDAIKLISDNLACELIPKKKVSFAVDERGGIITEEYEVDPFGAEHRFNEEDQNAEDDLEQIIEEHLGNSSDNQKEKTYDFHLRLFNILEGMLNEELSSNTGVQADKSTQQNNNN